MPKFGSHMLFAETASSIRPDLFDNLHLNALRAGAVGPDTTLFMFDPATSNPDLRKGFSAALEVLEDIQSIKDEFERIVTELNRPFKDIEDWLSGGLSTDLQYTLNVSLEALFLAAKLGVAVGMGTINIKNPVFSQLQNLPAGFVKDPIHTAPNWVISATDNFGFPFRMFGHPFTSDGNWKQPVPPGDYSEWWWMDLLHYRKTGQFASRLIENSSDSVELSYARGYMTHVGGDVCGHPFINALVGGPFRNHAYRHLVVETMADTWLWSAQGRGDVLGARFDQLIDLSGSEEDRIANLIVKTMREIYEPPMVPSMLANGYPTPDEWKFAFRLMQQYLRLSTSAAVPRPRTPPDTPQEVFEEIKELLKNNVPGSFPHWNGNVADFLKSLFSWFGKGLALLVMLATLPGAVLVRFMMVAPRWVIYLFNLSIYYIVSAIRTMLCFTGWGYCSQEDFANFGFLKSWISTPQFEFNTYPAKTMPNPKPPFYWLIPPEWINNRETEPTVPIPSPKRGLRPEWMMEPANMMDEIAVWDFIAAGSPDHTRQLERHSKFSFGNAVEFSISLLEGRFGMPVPDFDLDGDRGFGYHGWEELPPGERYV